MIVEGKCTSNCGSPKDEETLFKFEIRKVAHELNSLDDDDIRIEQVKAMSKKQEGGLNPGKEYNTRSQVVDSIEDTENKNRWITCRFNRKEGDTTY